MNSAEDELEAAMWSALTRHKVTCEHADDLLTDLLAAAVAYAAGDSDALTAERRRIIRLASRLRATIPADHPKGAQASFADYLRQREAAGPARRKTGG